jgi:hypothetical protein
LISYFDTFSLLSFLSVKTDMTVNTADFHGQKYGEATGKTNLYNLVAPLFKHTNEPWEKKLLRVPVF